MVILWFSEDRDFPHLILSFYGSRKSIYEVESDGGIEQCKSGQNHHPVVGHFYKERLRINY